MTDFLILRFNSPMMSFGTVAIDNLGFTARFPALSMVCGMLANALGYGHGDFELTQRLQKRLVIASRLDQRGSLIVDFQTVDLGQEFLCDTGWTSWGVEKRAGASGTATHIRKREYFADCIVTTAVALSNEGETPTLASLEEALIEPARPLFIGRKNCVPSDMVLIGRVEAESPVEALIKTTSGAREAKSLFSQWPHQYEIGVKSEIKTVTDLRDWANQVHTGERLVKEGLIDLE